MPSPSPGVGRHLACLLYEFLVVVSVLLIGFLMPQIVLSGFGMPIAPKLMWLHIFLLLLFYFVWFWVHGGQTLPMKTWKLRITDMGGGPLRPAQAILRYCAAWPSILCGGIGLIWAIFDRNHLFLHDRIAGTRIVFEPATPGK